MTGLAGQVALVTYAATGTGAGIARRFAAEGAHVVVHHSGDAAQAARVVADIVWRGGRAVALAGNLTWWPDVRRVLAETKAQVGRLDILVNTPGAGGEAGLFGAMLLCQEALRGFGEAGTILNVSPPDRAMETLTLGLARAAGGRNIHVHGLTDGANAARLAVELASGTELLMKMSA